MTSRNDADRKRLAAYFQRKNDPAFAFGQAVAMLQMFPGLVGLWPGSIPDSSGNVRDISGNAQTLTNTGGALFSADTTSLAPYIEFNGSSQYLTRADEALLSVTGTEAHIATAIQGLTLGGYFWVDNISTTQTFIGKGDAASAAGSSFNLLMRVPGTVAEIEIFNSTNRVFVQSQNFITGGRWCSVISRYVPGVQLGVWLDGGKTTNSNSIFSSINDTAAAFQIGAVNGSVLLDGRASLCFLCAAAVPDVAIDTFIGYTRPLYGV